MANSFQRGHYFAPAGIHQSWAFALPSGPWLLATAFVGIYQPNPARCYYLPLTPDS